MNTVPESRKSLDVIIVNWNSGPFLEKCIRSLYSSATSMDFRIIVVDNNSDDGSCDSLSVRDSDIIVKLESNIGFAGACNEGAKRSSSYYLLFLNPDTEVGRTTLDDAVRYLDSEPLTGILGVRQESAGGHVMPSCSRFLTIRNLINDATGLSKIIPRLMKPSTVMTDWDHGYSSYVDQVMGSFMLVRRDDFNTLGGFDERFFVYFEDMDFARRMLDYGKKSFYNNDIRIVHRGGASSEKIMAERLFYSLSSRIKYADKHLGKSKKNMIILISLFPEFITRSIYALFRVNGFRGFKDVLKGYRLFIKWLTAGS
ncbi:MAG: glycosyltransferase family 2 protein [Bacteroidales bacterium]|nr:glycosyltransferase family 2 protein [Bacteroidales bacterium]